MKQPDALDLADVLLRKSSQDEVAVRELLSNQEVADEIVGFHAQQAVEKALKAVLGQRGVRYPRTHDLTRLIELLQESGLESPEWLADADRLTRYAVVRRYEELAGIEEPLDREGTLELVRRVRAWAEQLIRAG